MSKESLKKVTGFNLYVNVMDQGQHSGVLYLDDIKAVKDAGIPEVPDNGGEQPGTPPGVLYKFESAADIAGWRLENSTTQAMNPEFDSSEGALSVEFPLTNTGKEAFELVASPSNLDLKSLDSIAARIKLSNGTAKARLFMKSGSGWAWSDSGSPLPVDANGFTTLAISLTEAAKSAGVDLKDIKAIGVKIEEIGNDGGSAKLLLKDVILNGTESELRFAFDQDVEGWGTEAGNVTVTQGVYSENGQSWTVLKNDLSWQTDGEYIAVSKVGDMDLSAFDGIEAKVKIVSDIPNVQAKLFIKLRNYAIWVDSGALNADGAGFATLRIDFSNMYPYIGDPNEPPFTPDDLKKGNEVGIQVVTPSGTVGNATVYIDEVKAYKN
ncbi:hypothetical protein HMSSN139_20340 [Paenibacillus sp. HMSSN-139]|nr:hypothetical protein HMSSN139_20340 [Paenibacillus sp. HMSSN-139]